MRGPTTGSGLVPSIDMSSRKNEAGQPAENRPEANLNKSKDHKLVN